MRIMSSISKLIYFNELDSNCKHLDTENSILNYFYCKKRKYHVNPDKFCQLCKHFK